METPDLMMERWQKIVERRNAVVTVAAILKIPSSLIELHTPRINVRIIDTVTYTWVKCTYYGTYIFTIDTVTFTKEKHTCTLTLLAGFVLIYS